MKSLSRILLLSIVLIMSFTCLGVYATWTYNAFIDDVETPIIPIVKEFEYRPEEVLPGDKEDTQLHENHYNLLTSIVNHVDYGLNASKKPIIRELLLKEHGVVYGDQNVSGGNLKHVLAAESSVAGGVQFAMKRISDTEYHTFTFVQSELNNTTQGNYLEVYKTVMVYSADANGKVCWHAPLGYKGRAKAAWCETDKKDVYSIDVNSWEKTL